MQKKVKFALLAWCFLGSTAQAAEQVILGKPHVLAVSELSRILFALIFVVIIIVLLAWLLKRLNNAGLGLSKGFVVLGSLNLGAREKIVLVKIGQRHLLLGVAPGSVNMLSDFGLEPPAGFSRMDNQQNFAQIFKKALGKS